MFRPRKTLPLGVDMSAVAVSIVAVERAAQTVSMLNAQTLEVPQAEGAQLDLKIAETVRAAVDKLRIPERRCILGAAPSDVATRPFEVPRGMSTREARRAADLEADAMTDWPREERVLSLDATGTNDRSMLLSVARRRPLERLVAIARAAGLQPVAVDSPATAWRRAVLTADALLDCRDDRNSLIVFGEPAPKVHTFAPRLGDERLAASVRTALADARRDGVRDVHDVAVVATPFQYEALEALLRPEGYALAPLAIGDAIAPTWAFAFALASWSALPRLASA